MFKKLHISQKKSYNSRPQISYALKSANRNKIKQSSYARLHQAKKVIPNQSLNFRILSNDDYIYQGQWLGQYRHGEGIIFLKNGTLIIGHWQKDVLNGRALIITPFGAMISAHFIGGKLNGWLLAQHRDKVVIANLFYEDLVDGPRIVYEGSQQLWIASSFTIDGQLIKITHVQKGRRNKLPLFVQNDQLLQLFQQIVNIKNFSFNFKQIKTLNVSASTRYIGFVDKQNNPTGIGCTYSQAQCFIGNFKNGFLQHLGRMIFQNGDIYHGGLNSGQFLGHGIYYSPHQNQTVVMLSAIDEQPQILQQQTGYYLVDFQLKLGQKIHKQDKITFSPVFQKFIKSLQGYYHQYYIEQRMRQQQHYSNMSQQQSQVNRKINDIEQDQQNGYAIKPTKWIVQNQNNSAISQQGKQDIKINSSSQNKDQYSEKVISEQRYFSPKVSLDNQFYSIRIKQNQDPAQKQKFNKHQPNTNPTKKQMNSNKNSYIENASKSLDVNNLTFRGGEKSNMNNLSNIKHNKGEQQGQHYNDQFQNFKLQQSHSYNSYTDSVRPASDKNSSNFSHLDEKVTGMLKKSSFRKKIFD